MAATTLASAVVSAVLRNLNEVPASPRYWTRAEILDLVWEGLLESTLISGHLQTTVPVTLTGNGLQAAPPHVALLHIRIGNTTLQKYTIDELDVARPNWDNDPQRAPAIWCPFGLTQMLVYPRTATATNYAALGSVGGYGTLRGVSGALTYATVGTYGVLRQISGTQDYNVNGTYGTLRNALSGVTGQVASCTVLQLPAVLTEATIIPLEDEYVEALIFYAFSVARLKEGGLELRDAMQDYDRYLRMMGTLTERVGWKNAPAWTQTPNTSLADSVPRQKGG